MNRITKRQMQVLMGLSNSKTMKELALDLGLSVKTVEYHRAVLCRRLNIFDIAGLTRFAVHHNLVS